MASGPVDHVRRLWRFGAVGAASDGALLDRYVADRGDAAEAAFEELVRRHGPLVLRVCRGVLRDAHDAEDAFQAVFLVLANRAGSIRNRESVASWLFGVAHRVAMRGKRRAARRRAIDQAAAARTPEAYLDMVADPDWDVLHEEIAALPERLRGPVVLCGLQGLTYDAAAARLGTSAAAVRGRLARSRNKLRLRLTRRGVTMPAGFLVAGAVGQAEASVPASLLHSTLRIAHGLLDGGEAAILARGVLNSILINQLKVATVLLCLGALGGHRLWTAVADDDPAVPPQTVAPASAPTAYRLTGSVRLQGTGEPVPGGRITVKLGEAVDGRQDQIREITSGADGRFVADLPPGQSVLWTFQAPVGYLSTGSTVPQEPFVLTKSQPIHRRDIVVKRGTVWTFELLGPDRGPLKGGVSSLIEKGFLKAEADAEGRVRMTLQSEAGKATVIATSGTAPTSRLSHPVLIPLGWVEGFRPDEVRKIEKIMDAYRFTDAAGRCATIGVSAQTLPVGLNRLFPHDGEAHLEPTLVGDTLVIRSVFSEGKARPSPVNRSVTGRVVDGADRPIEGVSVGRGSEGGTSRGRGASKSDYSQTSFKITFLSNKAYEVVTDRDGRFRVNIQLTEPSGESNVNFLVLRKKGLAALESARFSFQPGPLDAPLELEPIRMEPGVSLSGTVVDPQGKPVEGAWVRPIHGLALSQSFARTDADGRFVLDDLPSGSVKLQVDFGSLTARIEAVATGGDEGLKIQLRPVSGASQPFRLAPPSPGGHP